MESLKLHMKRRHLNVLKLHRIGAVQTVILLLLKDYYRMEMNVWATKTADRDFQITNKVGMPKVIEQNMIGRTAERNILLD
ncbi:hypothetical protein D3C86_1279930 [compost metagenome]